MSSTPLLDRIRDRDRRDPDQPTPITERMSPFMRRLREKNLPVQDRTAYVNGSFVRDSQDGAA
jgi:hypothetical protein